MFNIDRGSVHAVVARRAARVGFGATLFAGALAVVQSAIAGERPFGLHLALWFGIVWASAFAAAIAAWAGTRLRRRFEPESLAEAGLVVPAVGLALMTPLTLQLPVVLWVSDLGGFDEWVPLCLVITGLAHVVLALLSAVRARQLARGAPAVAVSTIYDTVVVVSMIPFVIIYLIPPILVAVTGAAYLPVLYAQGRIAARERAMLDGAPPLARAIAA